MCPKCGYNSELEKFKRDVCSGVYRRMPDEELKAMVVQMYQRAKHSDALLIAEINESIARLQTEKVRLEEK